MTGTAATWSAAICLVLAAATLGWPASGRRARQRRLLATAAAATRPGTPAAAPSGRLPGPRWCARPARAGSIWFGRLRNRPAAGLIAAAVLATGLSALAGGPVAAAVVCAYGAVAARALTQHHRRRRFTARRAELLDLLGAAAADLRAGLPADLALAGVRDGLGGAPGAGVVAGAGTETRAVAKAPAPADGADSSDQLTRRALAAVRLAEQTGAPLAEVIERIEADARSADRALAASGAQVAGAQATAYLLAGLPVAGLGLGYAIGADPLPVLLHTPIGAACALGAVVLQLAGLGWAGRITRPAGTGPA